MLRAVFIAVVGLLVARVGAGLGSRLAGRCLETQQVDLLRKAVFYGVVVLTAMSVLHQLGFSLTIILGAAGVLSVAIGFASQTSASNLISGLFLIGEKPFSVGDVICVGETVGEVLSIDLLSVKLRTFDNVFVRVPNETLIKSQIVNLTRFDIRRRGHRDSLSASQSVCGSGDRALADPHCRRCGRRWQCQRTVPG